MKNTLKENPTAKQTFNIPLPSKIGVNQILILALIIAAFLLGSLMTKVSYLEQAKGTTRSAGAQTAQQTAPSQ